MHHRMTTVEEAHVEMLTPAGTLALDQRHEDGDRRVEAGSDVDERDPDADGPAFGRSVDGKHPDEALNDRVVTGTTAEGTVGAEPGDAAVDESGKPLGQKSTPDSPPLEGSGLQVLDQHVRAFEQREQQLSARGYREIDADGPFVPVDTEEVGGVSVEKGGAPVAGFVALRRLDLDHVGAVVTQDLRAERSSQNSGEIDDLDTREHTRSRALAIDGHGAPSMETGRTPAVAPI